MNGEILSLSAPARLSPRECEAEKRDVRDEQAVRVKNWPSEFSGLASMSLIRHRVVLGGRNERLQVFRFALR